MLTSQAIELARDIATSAHRGQLDKIRAPYIEHPAMVAFLVQLLPDFAAADEDVQEAAVCAAWLHDTVEDTAVTAESLVRDGFRREIVTAVVALTRTPEIEPDDYYATIREEPVARLVKTADLASNLDPKRVAKLDPATRARLEARYSHALEELRVNRSVITEVNDVAAAQRGAAGAGQ